MATNVVELRTPQGRETIERMLEQVTIGCIEDIHDAAQVLARMAQERGMQVAVCDDISSKEPMVDAEGTILNADIFRWLDDGSRWWEDHRLALHSPLPRACRYESEPFWVNERGFNTHWRNSYLEEIDLSDFERRSLCKAAIVIPVHLPFGQISASSFISVDREREDLSEEFALYGTLFAQVIHRFVSGYVQAHRTKRRIPSDCVLSKREVECLRWAAIGKTDREISMILERSHATIRYHIHRAGEKLESVNRAQTIFKAGQLGYLGASD
ncbi:MAG: LuxR C-terminal-related transcriptional regulator [Pseudomonadota bacterium]